MWIKFMSDATIATMQWGDDDGEFTEVYEVDKAAIEHKVREISELLDRLSAEGRYIDQLNLPGVLRSIAAAGSRLGWLLVDGANNETNLKQWLAEKVASGEQSLTITSDSKMHIPWGLVYDDDARALPADACHAAQFRAFWSLKYQLTVGFAQRRIPSSKARRSKNSMKFLSLFDRDEFRYIKESGDLYTRYQRYMELSVGAAFNIDRLDSCISGAAGEDTVLIFFGHVRDGCLVVDVGERIDPIDLRIKIKSLVSRSTLAGKQPLDLVILNACRTIRGESSYSLRSAFDRPEIGALIATEADVPREFAMLYGIEILDRLYLDGVPLGKAITDLRRDQSFWPYSLLYSCYASPAYQILPADGVA
jgi:hypothetical protein